MKEVKKYDLSDIDQRKEFMKDSVDNKTQRLIKSGFSHSGKTFSLSQNAQINITNLLLSKDLITYPVSWNTIDDNDKHDIADAIEAVTFYGTALAVKKGHLDSGTSLKDSIRSAATHEELDLIVDDRI